jgi:hypothetical protein
LAHDPVGGAPWNWPLPNVQGLLHDTLAVGYDGYIFQGTRVLMEWEMK